VLTEPDGHGGSGASSGDAQPVPGDTGEGYEPWDGPEGGAAGYAGTEGYAGPEGTDGAEGYAGPEGYAGAEGDERYAGPEGGDGFAGPEDELLLGPGDDLEGEPPAGLASAARPRPRRPVLTGLLVALVIVVIAAVIGFVHVNNEINPSGRPGKFVTVSLPRGASSLRIARLLAQAGVIHGPDVFEVYLKVQGSGPLLAGTYRLRTNESYAAVIALLQKAPVPVTYKLVVPEGFTIRQIAAAVGRLPIGISAAQFITAATSGQVRSPYEPAGTNSLEGLLFPATYPVPPGESADNLVEWMVSTFDDNASGLGLAAVAHRLGYSPYQVVKVASIVEREAKFDQDRGPIASAIYNRLAKGMPIGAESTLLYVDPHGSVDITAPSPYNTLVNKGLPPTPISNPGIPSLQAAIDPPQTSYLYWVEINPDGKMGFATTDAQFRQLQHDCRVVHLC
jgi:UPF0755 protein